jgi:hypothetical protein
MSLNTSPAGTSRISRFPENRLMNYPFSSFDPVFWFIFTPLALATVGLSTSNKSAGGNRCSRPEAGLEFIQKTDGKEVGDPAFHALGRPPLFQKNATD